MLIKNHNFLYDPQVCTISNKPPEGFVIWSVVFRQQSGTEVERGISAKHNAMLHRVAHQVTASNYYL